MAQLAKKLSNKPGMKQVKKGMASFHHPETQYFEAVGEVKPTPGTHEKYLIYSINSPKLNCKPSWVFTFFRQMEELVLAVACSSTDSPLVDKASYFDVTHSRVKSLQL